MTAMTTNAPVTLSALLVDTRDGEWGEGAETAGHTRCEIIRGTDFGRLHSPACDLPIRWIADRFVERKQLHAGDVVIETAGGTATQSTGRTAFISHEFLDGRQSPVLCSSFARHLRFDRNEVVPSYMYHLLQALYAGGYMAVFNLQHTGVARFQFTSFKNKARFVLPDKPAQKKIAAILTAYDELIANNQSRIALLESMVDEIYREWFVRRRPRADGKVCWELRSFGSFCRFEKGRTPEVMHREPAAGALAYLTVDVLDGTSPQAWVTASERDVVVSAGDIVMLMDGARSGSTFRAPEGVAASTVAAIRTEPEYRAAVFHYLRAMHDAIVWNNTGTAIPHANKEFINRMLVPLPVRRDVLQSFNAANSALVEQADCLRKSNLYLGRVRDMLLPRLISGKLRVDHLDIQFPPSMQDVA